MNAETEEGEVRLGGPAPFCRGPAGFAALWREAAANVETANQLLAGGEVERPFSIEPAPEGDGPPPNNSFMVRRERPDGSFEEVAFTQRLGLIQAAGFGHRTPLTAVLVMDYDDGRIKAMVSYEREGDDLTCCSDSPWKLMARALEPLFFARSAG